jgi:glycosyltransferase involved in cell wall biosynthesis
MKLLIHGQALWGKSAYAHQIRMLIDMLCAAGHTVGQACTFGFAGRKIMLGNVTLYPILNDVHGQDVINAHAINFGADYVISLGDVFMFDPAIWNKFKWIAWATVDSAPLWPGIREALKSAYIPVAYSEYGRRIMLQEGFDRAQYIPLAFGPEVYYPMPRTEARESCQIPQDRFVVGLVQANRQRDNRKNFYDQLIAFRLFQKQHPDAFLYLHTCMSAYRNGFDLTALCNELGMIEGRDYAATDEYIETTIGSTDEHMRALYNSFDVLLQATKAEGFGMPALEASACRVPVVYTDYAALPEAVHYGYRVTGDLEWQPAGSWYMRPHVASIVEALNRAYDLQPYDLNRGEPTKYRNDMVIDSHWKPFLETLAERLEVKA